MAGCVTAPFTLQDRALEVFSGPNGVAFVRTAHRFFEYLPDRPQEATCVEIDGRRRAYVDEASGESGEPILLHHGRRSWSYLYRKMIPWLVDEGRPVIAMDHLGTGRSDKPIDPEYYAFEMHVDRLYRFIAELELTDITAFVQDWGSLIGLYVVGTGPDLFDRIVVGNGFLPVFPEGTVPSGTRTETRATLEFLAVTRKAGGLHIEVWNTVNSSSCPDFAWDDRNTRALRREFGVHTVVDNGPRY